MRIFWIKHSDFKRLPPHVNCRSLISPLYTGEKEVGKTNAQQQKSHHHDLEVCCEGAIFVYYCLWIMAFVDRFCEEKMKKVLVVS